VPERLQALAEIGGAGERDRGGSLPAHRLLDCRRFRICDQPLGSADGERSAASDYLCELTDAFV